MIFRNATRWAAGALGVLAVLRAGWAQPDAPAMPTPRAVAESLAKAYQSRTIAQTVRVRVAGGEKKERVSRVMIRTQPLAEGEQLPSVAVRLGRVLNVFAEGGEVVAVSPQNKRLALVRSLPEGLGPGDLGHVVRTLPVPQLELAFGHAVVEDGGVAKLVLPPFGTLDLLAAEPRGSSEMCLHARTEAGPVEITLSLPGYELRSVKGLVPAQPEPLMVELACEPADPALAGWRISPEGRERVESVAELRASPAEVPIGGPMPGMGLMKPDLVAFPLREALADFEKSPTESGVGPLLSAFVLFRAGSAEATDAAVLACGALSAVKKDLDRRRHAGEATAGRLVILPVAVLELSEFQPSRPREAAQPWADLGYSLVWTSSGRALIDRFAPESPGVVVIADRDQIVRAIIPFDDAKQAPEAVLPELRSVLDDLSPPAASPDNPSPPR
jgi:hypothetical protein